MCVVFGATNAKKAWAGSRNSPHKFRRKALKQTTVALWCGGGARLGQAGVGECAMSYSYFAREIRALLLATRKSNYWASAKR